jgi:hypothetical protein
MIGIEAAAASGHLILAGIAVGIRRTARKQLLVEAELVLADFSSQTAGQGCHRGRHRKHNSPQQLLHDKPPLNDPVSRVATDSGRATPWNWIDP